MPLEQFDENNRMHLAACINDDNSHGKSGLASGTCVIYAYSDDGGRTFHRADGSVIDRLPLRVSTADKVAHGHWYMSEAGVCATVDGDPLVVFRKSDNTSQWRIFSDGKWQPPVDLPRAFRRARPWVDRDGVITVYKSS